MGFSFSILLIVIVLGRLWKLCSARVLRKHRVSVWILNLMLAFTRRTQGKSAIDSTVVAQKNKMGIKFIPFSLSGMFVYGEYHTFFSSSPYCVSLTSDKVLRVSRERAYGERSVFTSGGCAQRERKLVFPSAYASGRVRAKRSLSRISFRYSTRTEGGCGNCRN